MASGQRPLSELSPVAQRRNSPSWNQRTKTTVGNGDSSPFDSFNSPQSPRLFWKGRDSGSPTRQGPENRGPYDPHVFTTPSKRSSIENLKRASRVKNSSIVAREKKQEYDPTHIQVLERPLATGRPLSSQFKNNAKEAGSMDARRQLPSQSVSPAKQNPSARKGEFINTTSVVPKSEDIVTPTASHTSPSRPQSSPTKSSLTRGSRFGNKRMSFDPENDVWSDDKDEGPDTTPRRPYMHRQTKSVTFDAAPPQINEYEMTTPVPSSIASSSREGSYDSADMDEEDSFDRGSFVGAEDSFDASLEDTDKTPVVLPEDWRFMSPDRVREELQGEDDPFGEDFGSLGPDGKSHSSQEPQSIEPQVESLDSNSDHRPLPPLPPSTSQSQVTPDRASRLSLTMELANSGSRKLPSSLSPASCSKAEINRMGQGSVSLEDRLRLMMTQDQERSPDAEKQRERRMRRAGIKDKNFDREAESNQSFSDTSSPRQDSSPFNPHVSPPQISRESILRNIRNQNNDENEDFSSPLRSSSPRFHTPLDPDVPIPSLETDEEEVIIKEEPAEHDDVYDISEYYSQDAHDDHEVQGDDYDNEMQHHIENGYANSYSSPDQPTFDGSGDSTDGQSTPVPENSLHRRNQPNLSPGRSEVSGITGEYNFELDLSSYVDRSSTLDEASKLAPALDMRSIRDSLHRPETPNDHDSQASRSVYDSDHDGPSTPESVIHHSVNDEMRPTEEPVAIPDPLATVKSANGSLKTKPSLSPADVHEMAATRRKVSGQGPPIPSIPESTTESQPSYGEHGDHSISFLADLPQLSVAAPVVNDKRQSSLVKLDIPVSTTDESLGFGLDLEFDRVIEAQKRGYLMRQNTKVIVASSNADESTDANDSPVDGDPRGTKSAGNSPRKPSQQTWTTEPWNGKTRRQSIKLAGGMPKKKSVPGSVPPLPGQESNAKQEDGVDEQDNIPGEEFEEGDERGRLFVKVVGVKDLDLPLARGGRSSFALTLDNGLHCVTTSWLELGKSAPIGQEFELVVLNELEFQLTLQMNMEELKVKPSQPVVSSPGKPTKSHKTSTFSRVFASPKKRKELEQKQQLEAQQLKQRKAEEKALAEKKNPLDALRHLVASDGSFARAYVSLSDYEKAAFGRPLTVDVTCFNEWATDPVNNSKNKRSMANSAGSGVQQRPPYKIGNLELQLLYVPKPKGATDDDMPKSMNACIREMKEADNVAARAWEGFLSQQGGDCPYWRRRYFKLQGSKLTAYHETTRQPRATINLAKASKLIDDRSTLTQKETSGKGGRRRKSAFAEEEEGYMFVEEGFRIRFGNGEIIDFYADSAREKEGWMKVLADIVGKGQTAGAGGQPKAWTELVLKRERSIAAKIKAAGRGMGQGIGSHPPPSPTKDQFGPSLVGTATTPKPKHQHNLSQPEAGKHGSSHQRKGSFVYY
ncbi:GTP binding protein [Histoplasma capsulatum var. duboisii H88]|uniref:GTP binding protein n=1 Tax=Ajellomyces capsulatus (strain H88) TaxID=544711 RepID=A0A8A1LFV0_AJEC8|nr:GTP binding protein [Histoplasma capsulatum var. duboisii H88]